MVPQSEARRATASPDSLEPAELNGWFRDYRDRLKAMIDVRLAPRLAGRIDASDVIQETFLEASQRYDDYRRKQSASPYIWLRFLALQRLQILYRRHFHTLKRAAGREAPLPELEASSIVMAQWLADSATSPSRSAVKHEQLAQLRDALETLTPQDREILTLRHFEQLSHEEAAEALGITRAAASRRYYRALERLRETIAPVLGDAFLG